LNANDRAMRIFFAGGSTGDASFINSRGILLHSGDGDGVRRQCSPCMS
jgi:hypothetical protein